MLPQHDEVLYVYQLFTKVVKRYNIPGDYGTSDAFIGDFLDNFRRGEPLNSDQSRFFNFLLDNRELLVSNGNNVKIKIGNMLSEPHVTALAIDQPLGLSEDSISVSIKDLDYSEDVQVNRVNQLQYKNKIVHVVNMVDVKKITSQGFKHRVNLTLKSIDSIVHNNVIKLAASSDKSKRPGWVHKQLGRSARTDGYSDRHLAYITDLLDVAIKHTTSEDDYILYSNLDCIVTPSIYKHIQESTSPVIEFHRRDIPRKGTLNNVFQSEYNVKHTGIDAFAIQVKFYKQVLKKILPDMFIGEPHWDTVLSNIIHQYITPEKNTTSLYHIEHDQTWNTGRLSPAGKYNKQCMHNCVQYGLTPDQLISIRGEVYNILFTTPGYDTIIQPRLYNELVKNETILVCYIKDDIPTDIKKLKYINKLYVTIDNRNTGIDQTNALTNKFVYTNPTYKQFNIYHNKTGKFTIDNVHKVYYNKYKPMNVYKNNNNLTCYLNDNGMLQHVNL